MCIFFVLCLCVSVCACVGDLLWYSHFVLRLSVSCQTFIFISPAVLPRGKWNLRNYKHSNHNMHSLHLSFCLLRSSALPRVHSRVSFVWNTQCCSEIKERVSHDKISEVTVRWCEGCVFWAVVLSGIIVKTQLLTPEASVQVMLCRLKQLTTNLSSSVSFFTLNLFFEALALKNWFLLCLNWSLALPNGCQLFVGSNFA